MASSRKRPSGEVVAEVGRFLGSIDLRGKRLAVGLSGGVDSVTLLHVLKNCAVESGFFLDAIHVHHGLSPNADAWAQFCGALCARWGVPLGVRRVKVAKKAKGLEAAAREARYKVFTETTCDAVVLAHPLDDQAETVLMNLLRGAGVRGASGMPARSRFDGKMLLRPLLEVPRAAIVAYSREHALEWVEDESNADESLTRNFVRRRLAPLIEMRFPRWRENLARAARRARAAARVPGRAGTARAQRGEAHRDAEAAHLGRRPHPGRARGYAAARLPRQARGDAGHARAAVHAGGMERRAAHSAPRPPRQAALPTRTR